MPRRAPVASEHARSLCDGVLALGERGAAPPPAHALRAVPRAARARQNYDFESTDKESPVVKAAIRTLGEVEHRALTPLAYWKVRAARSAAAIVGGRAAAAPL